MTEPWPVDLMIFDLDGTLVDSSADIAAAVNHVLGNLGRSPLPAHEILGHVGDGSVELIRRCLGGGADPNRSAAAFRRYYREHACDRSRLYPAVAEVLEELGEIPMALVTNKPLVNTLPILEGFGIARRFDPILGERSLPRNKPHPDAIRFALEVHGADPSRALMIGDGPQDLIAGKRAHVRVVAALWGFGDRDRLLALGPDAWIESFSDLTGLVARPDLSDPACA